MNRELRKILRRSIRRSLGRFLAILAIVALGVGFFAGLKSSQPALLHTADDYFRRQRMYDFQLMSSLGLTEEDAGAFRALPGIEAVEGARFQDAWTDAGVFHFMSLTESVAAPYLLSGRLPENPEECLGDEICFSERDLGRELVLTEDNDTETREHFRSGRFTIVGIARSPRFISRDRGSSTLGSGKPEGFLIVLPEAFTDEVWHELLLWCALPGEIYSETYRDALRGIRPAVETLLNRRGVLRVKELRKDADEELQKARDELREGWIQYRLGKRRSDRELDASFRRLTIAEEMINSSWSSLDAQQKAFNENEASIRQQRAELTARQTSLAAKQAEHAAQQATLQSQQSTIRADQIELETLRVTKLLPYSQALASVYTEILVLQGIGLDPGADLENQRVQAQAALDEAEAKLDQDPEIVALNKEIAELQAAYDSLKSSWDAVDRELSAEAMELQTLEMTVSAAEQALEPGRQMLIQAGLDLQKGAAEVAEGWRQYNEGKEKAEKELAEALEKLENGEAELAAAEEELEAALQLDLYTLDRSGNSGYVTFENDTAIVDGLAVAFPLFFALVAALVCVTTMTRMVNEERTQIGTLKALGYSAGSIMSKYLLYAGLSAFLGCVLGYFLGCTGLPLVIWHAYSIMYRYEDLIFLYNVPMFLLCLLVSVAGSVLVTRIACGRVLAEKPAELMRPKAPTVGKRVLLERIPFLWRPLPFLSKVSIRNAFRYPVRVLMIILGVGGCTALMVAGFGIRDSVSDVAGYQYGEIALYDLSVNTEDGAVPDFESWMDAIAPAHREEVRLLKGEDWKDTELIMGEGAVMEQVFCLRGVDGTPIPWPWQGEIVITVRLSEVLNLKTGDSVRLRLSDGEERDLTVSGVCEYYVGHAVFMGVEDFQGLKNNSALIRVAPDEDIGRRAAQLRAREGVLYVSLSRTEREIMEASMTSLDLVVVALVCCSAALAFITLYNLTNINLLERVREVATVKVLGFTPQETAQYILNENVLLSALGGIFGLELGRLLHRFVIDMVHVDYLSFDIRIAPLSYALSFVLTLVFTLLINLFMRRKLAAVNMAESLKSVE